LAAGDLQTGCSAMKKSGQPLKAVSFNTNTYNKGMEISVFHPKEKWHLYIFNNKTNKIHPFEFSLYYSGKLITG